MQVVLVMFRSDGERRSFSVTRDIAVIGRREDCDLRIPLSDVSRKHCRLIRDGDGIRLEDLGSSNGTFLNGQRVQEAMLAAGDTVQVGPVIFCVQLDGVPAEEDMAPIYPQTTEVGQDEGAAGQLPAEEAPAELEPDLNAEAAQTVTSDNQGTDSGQFSLHAVESPKSEDSALPLEEAGGPAPDAAFAPPAEEQELQLDEPQQVAAEQEPAAEVELTDDLLDFDITAEEESTPNDTGTIDGDVGDVHADSQDSHH